MRVLFFIFGYLRQNLIYVLGSFSLFSFDLSQP